MDIKNTSPLFKHGKARLPAQTLYSKTMLKSDDAPFIPPDRL